MNAKKSDHKPTLRRFQNAATDVKRGIRHTQRFTMLLGKKNNIIATTGTLSPVHKTLLQNEFQNNIYKTRIPVKYTFWRNLVLLLRRGKRVKPNILLNPIFLLGN